MPLLEGKLKISQGYDIYIKVTGQPGSQNDGLPYVLIMQGGPGFNHNAIEGFAAEIEKKYAGNPSCHFIMFDPLSNQIKDADKEYTISNFAEVAVQVVEAVKNKLNIFKMDLHVLGRSFGAMVAMAIPPARPNWIEDKASPICLNQLILMSLPVTHEVMKVKALQYLTDHYQDRPDYKEMYAAMERENRGEIATDDKNYQFANEQAVTLAPLFSDKYDKLGGTTSGKVLKYLLQGHFNSTMKILDVVGHVSSVVKDIHEGLTGCNVTVLNHFYRQNIPYKQDIPYDAKALVAEFKDLYQQVSICCVSGKRDHVANPSGEFVQLMSMLPDSFSDVIFNAKHSIHLDFPDVLFTVMQKLLTGNLTAGYLEAHRQDLSQVDTVNAQRPIVEYKLATKQVSKAIFTKEEMLVASMPSDSQLLNPRTLRI